MPEHSQPKEHRRGRRPGLAGAAIAAWALSGCAVNAPVGTEFPSPLVDPLPLHMGVSFPEELTTYEHVEVIPGDREWIVRLGPANRAMFARLFSAMFEDMTLVGPGDAETGPGADPAGGDLPVGGGSPEPPAAPLDAILVPSIESFEFANPVDHDTTETTVWITYRMRLTTPDGRLIAEWPVRAYGRSPYSFLGAKDSLVDATHMAMRDAGAYLALHFASEPRVREWLRETGRLENSP